jgi:hypothetical protein
MQSRRQSVEEVSRSWEQMAIRTSTARTRLSQGARFRDRHEHDDSHAADLPDVRHAGAMAIHITGDDAADQVLTDSPFALLVGMMLDQQYPMDIACDLRVDVRASCWRYESRAA